MHYLRRDDCVYRPGVPPEEGKYPGFAHTVRQEHGLMVERDVGVRMRDGVILYVDVMRPAGEVDLPVILTYSPYGKHAVKGPHMLVPETGKGDPDAVDAGLGSTELSHYTAWEGPDPLWWCKRGFAVVNADARGSWSSEGTLTFFTRAEAEDGFDLVEWAAHEQWSNGRVGMMGVSYLAWSQWNVAALQPPHLFAINPWEGFSDPYRDFHMHGGIRETNFKANWVETTSFSRTRVEDIIEMAKRHPLFDEYWEERTPDLSKIVAALYAVVDWGDHGVHTRGTIEGFKQVASKDKWLEVHGRLKWPYFYRTESLQRQLAFFNRFLKDDSEAMLDRPRVELEIRESYFVGEVRSEDEWPLARTQATALYLDSESGALSEEPPAKPGASRYESEGRTDCVQFRYVFPQETELTGNMALHIWLETPDNDDMDVFVALDKLDREGKPVGFPFQSMTKNGPVGLGCLRASHRELDEDRSVPLQPWHTHRRELLLTPGDVTAVDIEILPSSTLFRKGEGLLLTIGGHDIHAPDAPYIIKHEETRNKGTHIVHTGADHPSHLLVPVIPVIM